MSFRERECTVCRMARKRQPGAPRAETARKRVEDRAAEPAPDPKWLRTGGLLLAIVTATLAVYQPAWTGTLLWDDAAHLTSPALQTLHGLWRIWFDPGATQQYYPLLHSAFWVQHKLWGDATLGYHLVSVVLHACSALLVALVLRRLAIPGAWLAAAIFALHPANVESVAWIAELKNTLSGVLGLAAVYVYLVFDQSRDRKRYALAILLFALALAAKTVTAMLPVMLLAAIWWRRGSLGWRRDLLPITPFVLLGGAAGLTTAFIERSMIGASGAVYDFTVIERCLIAGRAIWFYLGTFAWPLHLVFIYPRWQISQAVWWQYLYPVAALALFVAAGAARRRTRAPLAALLAYCAALFPALGFFNVYPFRYSFVADHFAYLAGIPLFALCSGCVTRYAGILVRQRPQRLLAVAAAAVPLLVLGTLTFRESRKYANPTVLYETTLRDNPSCWLAHVNLGITLADTTGNLEAAVRHFKAALRLEPRLQEGHLNLGLAYERMGRLPDAIASYEQALGEGPDVPEAHVNLCHSLRIVGRLSDARAACERAVAVAPGSAGAQFGLGATLRRIGDFESALGALTRAARLAPEQADIYAEMGITLRGLGRMDEAEAAYRKALQLEPRSAESLASLGFVLSQRGRVPEAMRLYGEAIRIDPRHAAARYYLGCALQSLGRVQEAIDQYREALAIDPSDAATHNNLGLAFEELGRPGEAAVHYREALHLRPDLGQARENLARVSGQRNTRVPRSPIAEPGR